MQYRNLGRSGLMISPLCLGTWNFGDSTPAAVAEAMVHRAIDAGINIIDTADVYADGECERILGRALAGSPRDRVILVTKAHYPTSPDPNDRGNSRRHLLRAAEDSLRRLGTDWIDIYLVHRPDLELPQEESLRALDDLVRQGKVRYIGCSTYPAWLVMEALALSERLGLERFIVEEPPYNLLDRRIENELVPLALRYGMGLLTWAPLAAGQLAGRYTDPGRPPADSKAARIEYVAERISERGIDAARRLALIARGLDMSASQLALLWAKDRPGVSAPIIGPRTMAHLEEALPVLDMVLDAGTESALDAIVPPGSAVADFHNTSGWMRMRL
ncbi:MAG TPA: aldo/keto reductase, partial [Rectinemataceae bacterium]|nr:aldo/keto reductase [Rectinemataceae bacterium]